MLYCDRLFYFIKGKFYEDIIIDPYLVHDKANSRYDITQGFRMAAVEMTSPHKHIPL